MAQPKKPASGRTAAVLIVLCAGAWYYFDLGNNRDVKAWLASAKTTSQSSSFTAQAESPAAAAPAAAMPLAEQELTGAVSTYAGAFDSAPNDMLKGATRVQRRKALCAATGVHLADWIGKIEDLSSNNDGNGVLEIRLDDKVTLKTWNNSFSDMSDHTLIPADSQLFATVSSMKEGDTVRFSATLFPDRSDCFHEVSMTRDGGMEEPAFLARFTAVQAAQ